MNVLIASGLSDSSATSEIMVKNIGKKMGPPAKPPNTGAMIG